MSKSFTNKEMISFYFGNPTVQDADSIYICQCGSTRKLKANSGYTNLITHIKSFHSDWKETMTFNFTNSSYKLNFDNPKATNIFSWIDLVVMENREFSFTEKQLTRKYSNLEPICTETLMKYMELLSNEVESKIKEELPEKFGLVFDAWTEGSTHYVAIFATYGHKQEAQFPLLSFSPLINEEDLSASSYWFLIIQILEKFGKNEDNIIFLVGDNCQVNKSLADLMNIPLVGCASHRLNLAVQEYLNDSEDILQQINKLMKKLSTIKKAAKLRKFTNLLPITRNTTRWTSTFKMVERYFKIKEHIDSTDPDLATLLPSPMHDMDLLELYQNMKDFHSVTMKLQEENIDLSDSRYLFDALINKYPTMERYLSPHANIVHSQHFEKGVVKILTGYGDQLNDYEKNHLLKLRTNYELPTTTDDNELTFAERAIKAKKQRNNTNKEYIDLKFIPPTSNIVERLFSKSKLILSDVRKSMLPANLEMLLFLKVNRNLWDLTLVGKCLK